MSGARSATTSERTQSSYLATAGVRTHAQVGGLTIYPSVGYTVGSMAVVDPAVVVALGVEREVALDEVVHALGVVVAVLGVLGDQLRERTAFSPDLRVAIDSLISAAWRVFHQ